jgi:CDP-glucose 4,6-dehydratase
MGREDLRPVILNEATGEIPHQYLDCSKARRELDWRPRHGLETGLSDTVAWYRNRMRHLDIPQAAALP